MPDMDASSAIYTWHNYPLELFPKLWNWISSQIANDDLTISEVALNEIKAKLPECATWLKGCGITVYKVNQNILQKALDIKETFRGIASRSDLAVNEAHQAEDSSILGVKRAYHLW